MNLCVGRVGPLLPGYRHSQTFYWMGCPEAPKRTSPSLAGGSISLFLKAVEETKAQKPQSPWSCLLGREPPHPNLGWGWGALGPILQLCRAGGGGVGAESCSQRDTKEDQVPRHTGHPPR